jgi:hypothetical protein
VREIIFIERDCKLAVIQEKDLVYELGTKAMSWKLGFPSLM